MIDLSLARISRLLQNTPQTWKAIHVAGTNGKGSICALVSAMLHASGKSCARFNSPHFIDRWDCITINEKPVSEKLFLATEKLVQERNHKDEIGATEFELLTATAFEIMHTEKVDFGVIEVGMGGTLDATNAMKQKTVTVIAKIGLDHQFLLGNNIEEIAVQKAGIMRKGVPCVVDDSNPPTVLQAIQEHAMAVGVDIIFPTKTPSLIDSLSRQGFEPHQIQHVLCAHAAVHVAHPEGNTSLEQYMPVIKNTRLPGRLQRLELRPGQPVLLDGAHNIQSAEVLADYVEKHLRTEGQKVTWILAASQGKDLNGILGVILRPEDIATAIRFGPVAGMPWVKPVDPSDILDVAQQHDAVVFESRDDQSQGDVLKAALDKGGPVVIAGSLYLVSDVLRWLRDHSDPSSSISI